MSEHDKWRYVCCITLIVGMIALGGIIGLGKVMKDSSYGLDIILLGLANALNNLTKERFNEVMGRNEQIPNTQPVR